VNEYYNENQSGKSVFLLRYAFVIDAEIRLKKFLKKVFVKNEKSLF
jgi:hypothetical protein